ncbi:serine/threonine-protein kinase MARK2-like [Eptesicus fuscus]|uniref:serine/threonine-protein kinase MARK2-like n=1 Tax=Eptesicus fuscus TaxID=29078 RepID=UPI002403FF30|nr:serine/threonine-protein kinase MARK2-like [Eptesicus fuscus]
MSNDFAAPSAIQGRCIGDYVLRNPIGQGARAKVPLAWHVLTGTEAVGKAISLKGFPRYHREVYCLQSLNHPNITELFEVIATPDKLYLIMEHVREGDLREHLENHGPLSERQARAAFRQVVSALRYCHQRGIAHRDLKPDNILLDEARTVRLADFGFSRRVSDDCKLSTFCGTFHYMAPELLQREPYDGRRADVWSLGVTLYRTLTGTVPFHADSFAKMRDQVLAGQFEVPPFMTRKGSNFLKTLLTVDPSQRSTLEEVMQHPWLTVGQEEELRPYSEPLSHRMGGLKSLPCPTLPVVEGDHSPTQPGNHDHPSPIGVHGVQNRYPQPRPAARPWRLPHHPQQQQQQQHHHQGWSPRGSRP